MFTHGGTPMAEQTPPATEAERIFQALSQNGQVHMPIAQTFWAERLGMLADRFGIPWMVNCEGKVKYE